MLHGEERARREDGEAMACRREHAEIPLEVSAIFLNMRMNRQQNKVLKSMGHEKIVTK
jgi:hypothetical protein